MTSRQLYEAVIIELNKENAPNILLEDFNYFANKSINQYINKRYNIYDINQQTTDDLRVLKATALLTPKKITETYKDLSLAMGATYEVILPDDYLHILNCICIYDVKKTYKCYNKDDTWRCAATRLTADAYSQVLDNFWNRPTYKRPYYYIHNVNIYTDLPTNPYRIENGIRRGTDAQLVLETPSGDYSGNDHEVNQNEGPGNASEGQQQATTEGTTSENPSFNSNDQQGATAGDFPTRGNPQTDDPLENENTQTPQTAATYNVVGLPKTIKVGIGSHFEERSNVEREASLRYGNVTQVRMEIRYGTDDSIFALKSVYIDYIKTPQHIRLTQKELDTTEDTSQMLEFPDYVCHEIINELVHIIMENITDQRLQTHPVVSQSIANPAQQQTEPVAQAT